MIQIQWTFDPATPVPPVVIECYQRTFGNNKWRWRARSMNNGRKLAHGGEGFVRPEALAHSLSLLWPPATTRHVVVKGLP